MVEENIGLAHLCARRFLGRGMEYDDLFQAGCMGLVKATAAFDESRGVMFSTYAVPVILGEIRRLFRDGGEGWDGGLSRGVHGDGAAVLVGHHPVPDPLKDLRVKGLEGELGVELAGFHDRLPPDGMWILHILCASGGRGTGVAGGAVL